ncbi:ABC transporter substrate-binding protein, partial [Arthrobacter sp. ISL-48]|uniref:ABC transporter substrate-binding protein n=1 Tax=Arthrobacter sp. ISL-48 TaxID=2819110 RepID=UPI001BEBE29B
MSSPQDKSPQNQQGSTRIVAGQASTPKRPLGLKIGIVAGLLALVGGGGAVASAVSANNASSAAAQQVAAPARDNAAAELKLGYFANVTHAPALVGLSKGFFAKELGGTKLSTQVFNAGPAAIEALNAGAIDAAYLGPNPAINSFVKSQGESISIIAGAAAGGAQLVVRPEINSAADLKGKT